MNPVEILTDLGFTVNPILEGSHPGYRVTPNIRTTVDYFEQWIKLNGKRWILDLIHSAGFLVLENNTFPKSKRRFLGKRRPSKVYDYFGKVYSDPRSLFWHSELEINIDTALREVDEGVSDNVVRQYVGDPLRSGILFLHYDDLPKFGRSHACTGVGEKNSIAEATLTVAEGAVRPEIIAKIDFVVDGLRTGLRKSGFNINDYEPLYGNIVNLLIGCHPDIRHDHSALEKTKELLGDKVYWHDWSSPNQTLVISNKMMAHSRLVYESRKMDALERGILFSSV